MDRLEAWRLRQASSICPDQQITAFHLVALTEEKFRVIGLSGFLTKLSPLGAHAYIREDLFALEWALRSLRLPAQEFTQIERLRDSWTESIADRATILLTQLSSYCQVRDLVICTKRGGYLLDTLSENEFRFTDNPEWLGTSDAKSRLISEEASAERNATVTGNLETFTLEQTTLYEDFPHYIKGQLYSASDFWAVWDYLWKMCANKIVEDFDIRSYGDYVATSETRELGIIITRKKLTDAIAETTHINMSTVSTFLRWMTLNTQTPSKFTIFHCPLVEVNEKFVVIPPHALIMAHVPTVFLRHLAHNDKHLYDACSRAVEKEWLRRLQNHLQTSDRPIRIGVKLHTPDGDTEMDLVEYDKAQSLLSVAQAKLTIRSDSAAEVDHRNEMLRKGIEQLKRDRRLLEGARSNLTYLLSKLGEETPPALTIRYFLLPTKTVPSDYVDVPSWVAVLPVEFCLRPQCTRRSLVDVYAEYKERWDSLTHAVDSSRCEEELEIAGFRILYPAFKV